jgi:hypothetical protein
MCALGGLHGKLTTSFDLPGPACKACRDGAGLWAGRFACLLMCLQGALNEQAWTVDCCVHAGGCARSSSAPLRAYVGVWGAGERLCTCVSGPSVCMALMASPG